MEWKTHFLAGAVAGGVVTGDLSGLMLGGLFGLFPDVDEPKSKVGKVLWFISFPLSVRFRHRTFTHSLLFVALMTALVFVIDKHIALIAFAGLLSHIFCDMLTGKVNLFYPTKKWVGVSVKPKTVILLDRFTRLTMGVALIGLFVRYSGLLSTV